MKELIKQINTIIFKSSFRLNEWIGYDIYDDDNCRGESHKIINAYIFKGDIIIDIDTGHSFSLEDLTENELRDLLNIILTFALQLKQ